MIRNRCLSSRVTVAVSKTYNPQSKNDLKAFHYGKSEGENHPWTSMHPPRQTTSPQLRIFRSKFETSQHFSHILVCLNIDSFYNTAIIPFA